MIETMLETGALAPHFTLLGADGREYSLPGNSAAEPLVLVFLKTGCAACDVAMPYLNNLHNAYPAGWRLWAVIQEPPEKARDYLAKYKATYPFLIDPPNWEVSRLYDPPATPTIFVVEPSGRVSYSTHGFSKDDLNEVSARIAAALGLPAVEVAPLGDGHPDFRPGCVPRHLMPSRSSRLPMSSDSGRGPLAGVTVLDLTWVLSGPFGAMILCDMGADVIKVERPPYGDVARTTGPYLGDESGYFFSINRGKRSICLDLKSEAGRDVFLRLVEKVDVVLENFTPGTMDELGVGYGTLSARNPRLIYAATSGFGQTGPDRERPALDIIVQGMGGIMSITGEPGGDPVRPGISQGDITAGLYTAIGVLAALHERERSGRGQMIDISMLDCQIAILENAFVRYFATGEPPKPIGTRHPLTTPFQAFPTKDGWIVIALSWGVENQWELFCATIGRHDLIGDSRFATPGLRTKHHAELEPALIEALRRRTTDEWLAEFDALGMPCGPLNDIPHAAEHPQVKAREMLVDVEHPSGVSLRIPDTPVKLSRTPGGIHGPPPALGEHTDDVLRTLLGLDDAEISALREAKAVFGPLPSPVPMIRAEESGG